MTNEKEQHGPLLFEEATTDHVQDTNVAKRSWEEFRELKMEETSNKNQILVCVTRDETSPMKHNLQLKDLRQGPCNREIRPDPGHTTWLNCTFGGIQNKKLNTVYQAFGVSLDLWSLTLDLGGRILQIGWRRREGGWASSEEADIQLNSSNTPIASLPQKTGSQSALSQCAS